MSRLKFVECMYSWEKNTTFKILKGSRGEGSSPPTSKQHPLPTSQVSLPIPPSPTQPPSPSAFLQALRLHHQVPQSLWWCSCWRPWCKPRWETSLDLLLRPETPPSWLGLWWKSWNTLWRSSAEKPFPNFLPSLHQAWGFSTRHIRDPRPRNFRQIFALQCWYHLELLLGARIFWTFGRPRRLFLLLLSLLSTKESSSSCFTTQYICIKIDLSC